jgi:hypothetical protein
MAGHKSFVVALALTECVHAFGCSSGDFEETGRKDELVSIDDRASSQSTPNVKALCSPTSRARCLAATFVDGTGEPVTAALGFSIGPPELRNAYALPMSGGNGKVVAVIEAFDSPTAEQDLGIYRDTYGLPPCTTANGCFRKVNQDGLPAPLPAPDAGWDLQIGMDLDLVGATCPDCKLLLVEARSDRADDLGASVALAANLGAFAISMSYSLVETATDAVQSAHFYDQPGVLLVASSGFGGCNRVADFVGTTSGSGVAFPASLPNVVAVGGTKLRRATSARGWIETVAMATGSGCSQLSAKPSWQTDACSTRTVVDVAAVSDITSSAASNPLPQGDGVAYYSGGSWRQSATSPAPVVAGIFTLFGVSTPSWPYAHRAAFFDVVGGRNGGSDPSSFLCNGLAGYDAPTGLGTPNGAAFAGESDGGVDAGPGADGSIGDGAADVVEGGSTASDASNEKDAGSGGSGGSIGSGGAPDAGQKDADVAADGSATSSTTSGTTGSTGPGGGSSGAGGSGGASSTSAPSSGGCGCGVPGRPADGMGAACVALLALMTSVRRRRRGRPWSRRD